MAQQAQQTTDIEREKIWLGDEGIPPTHLPEIVDEFGSIFEAADHAYQGGDRLEQISGIGPSTATAISDLSPLAPIGEWTAEKTSDQGYIFRSGESELHLSPEAGAWSIDYLYDGDEPLIGEWRIEYAQQVDRVSAWWTARSLMDRNPQGPGSDIPRNVETPDEWFLQSNSYSIDKTHYASWTNRETGERLTVSHAEEGDGRVLTYRDSLNADREILETGTWADLLAAAGERMATL